MTITTNSTASASDSVVHQKPTPLPVILDSIPKSLCELKQWVGWRYELRDNRWTKPPINIRTGGFAASNASDTWVSFQDVQKYQDRNLSGIGFTFSDKDGLTGIDLDHVIDKNTGEINTLAQEVLDRFSNTYCEKSPSGDGIRIFVKGKPQRSGKCSGPKKWLEVYSHPSNRYLTVTGHRLVGTDPDIKEGQEALDWLHNRFMSQEDRKEKGNPKPGQDSPKQRQNRDDPKVGKDSPKTQSPMGDGIAFDDNELITKALNAANGSTFSFLWAGGGEDRSSGDQSLCNLLAFWTNKDPGRMDRLFRQSGRMRDKWDEKHFADGRTYGQATIDKAISNTKETYQRERYCSNDFQAKTPDEYYQKYYSQTEKSPAIFEFENKTYKGYVKKISKKTGEEIKFFTVSILDCGIKLLYSVIDDSIDDIQKMEHYIEIESNREKINRFRIDADSISKLDRFKSVLANYRQIFTGDTHDLNLLTKYLFNQKPYPQKIRELNTVGYDPKTEGFYFPGFGYDKSGKRIECNGSKFFTDQGIKPFYNFSDSVISKNQPVEVKGLIQNIYGAYGDKGLISLGFYISTLFSHKVFNHYGFFPFLSLYGDPHSGKSFLTKLLNRCFFIDSEGLTMTSSNTAKGELRKISQRSSLVCCLLEGRKEKSRFDYDGILALYNRNHLYSRATTDQTNKTHDLPFKGAMSFVWNHEAFTIKPAKERVISLKFSENDLTDETVKAWDYLNSQSPEQLAGLGDYILSNRTDFEKSIVDNAIKSSKELNQNGIKIHRIADNYGIALGGIFTLLDKLNLEGLSKTLLRFTIESAKNKMETAKTDNNLADYFFSSIEDLTETAGVFRDKDNLIINLPKVLSQLQANSNGFSNKSELITELKNHEMFCEVKNSRKFGGVPSKCYFFKVKSSIESSTSYENSFYEKEKSNINPGDIKTDTYHHKNEPVIVEKENQPVIVEKENQPVIVEKENQPVIVEKENQPVIVEKENEPFPEIVIRELPKVVCYDCKNWNALCIEKFKIDDPSKKRKCYMFEAGKYTQRR